MSGVFLSYSRGDRALALRILQSLRALSVDVWWDEDMPGVDWQDYLASKINELAAVLVIWTPLSTNSKNVKDEARLGQNTEKLVNVMVGAPTPPFPFDRVNGLPLDGWTGREPHNGWTRVIRTLEERLVAAGGAQTGELTEALRQRERTIADRRKETGDAEAAFAEAQAAEADSSVALDSARAEFAAAEAQLRSVIDMQAGPTLLKAAQQQLDAALAARTDAEQARRSAAAALAAASKSLSSARAELERLFGDAEPSQHAFGQTPSPPAARESREPPRPLPWLGLATAAGAVIALATVGVIALSSGAGRAPAASAASTDASEVAAATAQAPAADTRTDPAAALVGRWGVAGLGCASPVAFAEDAGGLTRTFDGETVSVRPAPGVASGAVAFRADDGAVYALRDGVLSMTPSGASRPMNMTRCAG